MQPQGLSCPQSSQCCCVCTWLGTLWAVGRTQVSGPGWQPARGATGIKEDCSRVRADGVGTLSLGMCHLLMGRWGLALPHTLLTFFSGAPIHHHCFLPLGSPCQWVLGQAQGWPLLVLGPGLPRV